MVCNWISIDRKSVQVCNHSEPTLAEAAAQLMETKKYSFKALLGTLSVAL
jgi:hypothetical protein